MHHIHRFGNIKDYHKYTGLSKPEHPLVSLIDYSLVNYPQELEELRWTQGFYSIGLKRNVSLRFDYGQQEYDFDSGLMTFVAPNQVLRVIMNPEIVTEASGYLLLIHPDFLWKTSLAKTIKKYGFFDYAVNEALFLSEKEEAMMVGIFKNIEREYKSNIDKFSQNIMINQIELLLSYAERFYERQFITRKITNHHILNQLEQILEKRFAVTKLSEDGLPTVHEIAENLNLTPDYLSSMLKVLTGQNTQQHIHEKLIETAKEQLSTTALSVSEIAYKLGFEYPASFSKLFKSKTSMSPIAFRQSFN